MTLPSLVGHAAELCRIIRKSPQAADGLASDYFRSKKYIGSKERRFLAEITFHALRVWRLAEAVAVGIDLTAALPPGDDGAGRERATVAAALALACSGAVGADITARMTAAAGAAAEDLLAPAVEACRPLAQRPEGMDDGTWASTQDWLVEALAADRGHAAAVDLFRSMLRPADVCLRVNLRRCSREAALAALQASGIAARAGRWAPGAIVLAERTPLADHPLLRNGFVDVQDEGSQMIGHACAPAADMDVLDACAGAGGKTLHLADLQGDRGRIVARDIELARLRELAPRARRAGVQSVRTELLGKRGAAAPRGHHRGFDLVLVDAPCSGMGTIRRLPMVKWRLTPELAQRHHHKQLAILVDAAGEVRAGGVLVYATCSVLPVENGQVVQAFLQERSDFVAEPLAPILAEQGIEGTGADTGVGMLQMDPHRHGTDGLFVARLRHRG